MTQRGGRRNEADMLGDNNNPDLSKSHTYFRYN